MLKERRLWLLLALLAGDTLAAAGALLAAYALRFSLGLFPVPLGVPPLEPYLFLLLPLLPLHALALGAAGLYRYRRERTKADEAFALVRGVTLAAILLVAATFFTRGFSYSRGVIVLFWVLDLLFVFWERLAVRETLRYLRRHGRFVRRVLIAGAGPLGQAVAHRLRGHPELGLRVVGFLDDRRPVGERVEGREVLGGFEAVQEVLARHAADQLFIALPLEAHAEMLKILNALEGELVDVKVIPDILQFITLKAAVEELDGLPIISLSEGPVTGWNRVAKRALDLAVSALALVILSPLFALIALGIRLTSSGPVIYGQERMGLDGRPFRMYKFRSMRMDAEAESGPVWTAPDDARRTLVGQFLRRFSLDELPQLWNVLRGEMSLVGPRPERPFFVQQFRTMIPQYMLRHKVKSGMTGWAQVNGLRGNTSLEKRIEYDLYYVENWSLTMDLKILCLTLWRAWRHRHAY